MSPQEYYNPNEPFFTESLVQSNSLSQNKYVPTYFEELGKVIKGFHSSNLIIIGGRPAMGCRMLALTMACKQAWAKHKVACFFMSLTESNLTDRVQRIYNTYSNPSTLPHPFFYIDYKLDIDKFRNEVARLKREENIEVVYVESIQMIGVNDKIEPLLQAGYAVKSLWEISREFDLPIVALSSLSRATEYRCGGRQPELSDLRESSAIEMYADVVLMLYRPEYYGILVDINGNSTIGLAEVIVAKNANGQLADAELKFGTLSVFDDRNPRF